MTQLKRAFEEVKLIYRNKTPADQRPEIQNAQSAYDILMQEWDRDQISLIEEFKTLLLDRRNRLMSIAPVSKGGMHGTVVDPKIAFMIALKRRASGMILVHNHPSGNLKPSQADITLTKRFVEAGNFLEIPVLDHLIITEDGFSSIIQDLRL